MATTRAHTIGNRERSRGRRHGAILLLAVGLAAASVVASTPRAAQELYTVAQAREQALRAALNSPPAKGSPALRDFRATVAAYRAVVWQHPTSGYCDNALWQGAQVAAEAFARFGDEHDRRTAVSMYKALVSEYPASPFIRKARSERAKLEAPAASPAIAAPAPTPPESRASREKPTVPAAPPAATGLVTLQAIHRVVSAESVQVALELDGPVTYYEERIESPPRVFFDLGRTTTVDALKDAVLTVESDLVRQIRVGRHPGDVTRVVLEIGGTSAYHAQLARDPYRLVIDVTRPAEAASRVSPTPVAAAARPPGARRGASEAAPARDAPPPAAEPSRAAPAAPAPATPDARPPAAPLAAVPVAPSMNLMGGFSIARQLGLGVSRIVIDPGHGGRDPGALGTGITEAAITLDVALKLEQLLAKEPGVGVVLTRRTDVYVPLEERTAIANREAADLFVSIHVNASRNASARGIETYLLNFASTADAASVAARENSASSLTMNHLADVVRVIALNNKVDESRDLASQIQSAMTRRLRALNNGLRDLGVKQAPFVVLLGASMPSVLVEVSFLTNRQEGRLLRSAAYRQKIADALLDGIRRYQRSLKKVQVLAEQGPGTGAEKASIR